MADHGHSPNHPKVGHLVGWPVLLVTAITLMVLTWVTVVAREVPLGDYNIWLALLIAVVKASLVCMFFMHLRWDRPFNILVLFASLLFLALFLGLAITDTGHYQAEIEWTAAPFYSQ
jgi:cytochrome c oxidase subunit 4